MASPPPDDSPSHRACAHCRSQKVRCLAQDNNSEVCARCAKSGRPCVFTPIQKRKQRKRTDTRVAELEREMRAMRAALKSKQQEAGGSEASLRSGSSSEGTPNRPPGIWYQTHDHDAPRVDRGVYGQHDSIGQSQSLLQQALVSQNPAQPTPQSGPPRWSTPANVSEPGSKSGQDVIDRGLLSMATARQLVDTFKTDLFPHYPTVAIPASMTADDLRQTRPTLFLSVLAAAAVKEDPDLSAVLDKEILEAYANRSLVHSEKSLEIVQALLISAVWYHPPSKFGQLKYYEYIQMAATMAVDIGISTRPKISRGRLGNAARGREPAKQAMVHPAEDASNPDLSMTPRSRDSSPDTGNLESRRTFLACYMICAGVSLSLRRPNTLRVSSYVRECVEYMERSSDAIPTDRTIVHWVRLVMIAEEISVSFSYDDPGGVASIADLSTQLMVKDFDKRLNAWWSSVPETDGCGGLTVMFYTVRLYLHELALHMDHSPEDFRAPYQMGTIHPTTSRAGESDVPTQVLAESIAELIASSHALLNTFFAMDVNSLRTLPVFGYVRISFAAFVLAKLCLSASHPDSRIYQVLDRRALKVESYMDRAVLHVRNIVGEKRCRVPAIFLALLFKLRQWCLNPKMIDGEGNEVLSSEGFEDGQKNSSLPSTDNQARAQYMGMVSEEVSVSGNESSPQSPEGRQQSNSASLSPEGLEALATANPPLHFNFNNDASAFAGRQTATSTIMKSIDNSLQPDQIAPMMVSQPQPDDWLSLGAEAMQLDGDYMQYFGDMMDGFSAEEGLSGDWMSGGVAGIGLVGQGEDFVPEGTTMPLHDPTATFGYGWQNG
ncbi:hypothetical protein LTS10_000750 [Elasticomyces elasticus]|nr:hypothetical protein LTS10_000750 [Elasticomyces elasticus]